MASGFTSRFKAPWLSHTLHVFVVGLALAGLLAGLVGYTAYAQGETYKWQDKNTITGSGGNLPGTETFSKTQTQVYPLSTPSLREVYVLSEPVQTADNCFVTIGIEVNGSDKSKGTLRRVVDAMPGSSSSCPSNYNLAKHFTTNLTLGNVSNSGSNPSANATVVVYSLVAEGDDFPGTSDTITLKVGDKTVGTKKTTTAYKEEGYTGFKTEFRVPALVGAQSFEACSSALSKCDTAEAEIIGAPLGVYVITITQESGSGPVCSAGALGWVICPAMSLMADASEWMANALQGYLAFNPFGGANNPIKQIWSNILNVANALLIIAFLLVIFSQATSVGISNYGVKRMVPRIIAAAILMNLSYYICQVLVDLSNIAGIGISSLVASASGSTFAEEVSEVGIGSKVAVATGIIAIMLFFFLVPVLLSFLAILLTIAARNAIIVLLVIVAPLAFAAWVLPNTEKYFKKWWETLVNMLILFPLTMLLFSASLVAANVISSAAPTDGPAGATELNAVIALLVLALPLFAMPFLFKTASGALGRINDMTKRTMNQYGGQQAEKGLAQFRQNKTRNVAARMADNKLGQNSAGITGKALRGVGAAGSFTGGFNARRKFKLDSQKTDAERLQQNAIADQLQKDSSRLAARSTLRGETGQAIARARGVAIQDKMIGEEVSAAKTVIDNINLSNKQRAELAVTGRALERDLEGNVITENGQAKVALSGDFYQKAAQQDLIATGQVGHVYKMLEAASQTDAQGNELMSQDVRNSMAYHLSQNYSILKAKDHTLNDDSIKAALQQGGGQILPAQYEQAAISKMSGLTKEVLAGQDAEGLKHLRNALQNGVGTPEEREKALKVVRETAADPLLASKMTGDSEKAFQAILQDEAYGTYSHNINPPAPPPANP